jgi:hypothetical protein
MRRVDLRKMVRLGLKMGDSMNAREGDGGFSRNRQGKRQRERESLVVEEKRLSDIACSAFLRVGRLDQPGD